MKRVLILTLCFLLMFPLASCSAELPDAVKILIPKIGKADCIIIYKGDECSLIDSGEAEDYSEISGLLRENGINRIDNLIITHFDSDHVGSAALLIDNFEVGNIYRTAYTNESDEYRAFIQSAEIKGISPITVESELVFSSCGMNFTVYPPEEFEYKKDADNNSSLVITVEIGKNRLLFAADAEKQRLTELLSMDLGTFSLLKVPHHGSHNGKTDEFIEAVSPEYSVITCSDKNPPEEDTLKSLKAAGSKVFETRKGDILIQLNSEKISISQ